jgi:hypothetical protein
MYMAIEKLQNFDFAVLIDGPPHLVTFLDKEELLMTYFYPQD